MINDQHEDEESEELSQSSFHYHVSCLQNKASEDLFLARESSKIKIQDVINRRKKLMNKNLFNLLGLPQETKVDTTHSLFTIVRGF